LVVGRGLLGPHGLGDDTEIGAGIEEVGAVGDDGEFEIAESCAVHEKFLVVSSRFSVKDRNLL